MVLHGVKVLLYLAKSFFAFKPFNGRILSFRQFCYKAKKRGGSYRLLTHRRGTHTNFFG